MITYTTGNTKNFVCNSDENCYCCKSWGVFISEKSMKDILSDKINFPEYSSSDEFCSVVNNLNPIYHALLKMKDGKCIFLDKTDKCKLFNIFGKENGNPLCLSFPFLRVKLKDRYCIVSSLTCPQISKEIFSENNLVIEELQESEIHNKWPTIILDTNEYVCFSQISNTYMTWDAFHYLENSLINNATYSSKTALWDTLYQLALINNKLMNLSNSIVDCQYVENVLREVSNKKVSYSESTECILFFLERKNNLYKNTPFKRISEEILNNENLFPNIQNGGLFREYLKSFDSVLKKLFILKLFSNPSNFLVSVQFSWHVLLFYFSFLKLMLYSKWLANKTLTNADITQAIQTIERHFIHDPKVFQFWGQGKRGQNDFSRDSLFKFII